MRDKCQSCCFFVLFGLSFTSQATIFELCREWSSWVKPVLSARKKQCVAQGLDTVILPINVVMNITCSNNGHGHYLF